MKSLFQISILLLTISSTAVAQMLPSPAARPVKAKDTVPAAVPEGTSVVGTAVATPTPKAVGQPAYTPTVIGNPDVSKTTGMENNGLSASKQQGDGGAAAAAAMAAMAASAAATCPACEMRGTCPICAASLIGAAASGLTGNNMDSAQSLSNQQVKAVNPTATPPAPAFASSPLFSAASKDIQKATAGTGYKVSADYKSVTSPDGRTIDTKSAATSGAGLSGLELLALKDQLKKGQEAAGKVAGMPSAGSLSEETAGAGGGGSASTEIGSASGSGAAAGLKVSRNPANVAGTYKDLNGDRIGVSVDSMFEMMHRRYRANSDREYFIAPKK